MTKTEEIDDDFEKKDIENKNSFQNFLDNSNDETR